MRKRACGCDDVMPAHHLVRNASHARRFAGADQAFMDFGLAASPAALPALRRRGDERPETWVTFRTGHMGDTFRFRAGGVDAVESESPGRTMFSLASPVGLEPTTP